MGVRQFVFMCERGNEPIQARCRASQFHISCITSRCGGACDYCLATIFAEIFLYTAGGRIFFDDSCDLLEYGRPAMILAA